MPKLEGAPVSKRSRLIACCFVVALGTPAVAVTPVSPVGIESCDAFLAA